jgi:hypothetical protein
MAIDTTNHGKAEILKVDLKRIFSSQKNLDEVLYELVDPEKRRRIQPENWEKLVLPMIKENSLDLEFYRDDDGYLYHISEKKETETYVDEYAIEGCSTMSS